MSSAFHHIRMGEEQPFVPRNLLDHVNAFRRVNLDEGWDQWRHRATDSCVIPRDPGDRAGSHMWGPRRNYGCVPPFAKCLSNILDYEGYLRSNIGVVGDQLPDVPPSSSIPTEVSVDHGPYDLQLFQTMKESDVNDIRSSHEFLQMQRSLKQRTDELERRKALSEVL